MRGYGNSKRSQKGLVTSQSLIKMKQVSKVIWQEAASPSCYPRGGEWMRLIFAVALLVLKKWGSLFWAQRKYSAKAQGVCKEQFYVVNLHDLWSNGHHAYVTL